MLDFIWSFAIIAGTVACFITHGPQEAASAITDGAAGAVELCIFMAGTMSFWSGIMNIAQESGLIDSLSKKNTARYEIFVPGCAAGKCRF